ncbi:MAG: serine/threonine-protein kinase [Deltaproteobacteria bacterium]
MATVQPGDVLCDRYRVDRVLGAGGMGVVVLAEHIELRERVAIKFLLDDAAEDSELSERFLREARAAVKIRSEHVVRVSDVGRLPSGAPYLVMEYLEGEDLSQRLERGRVPIEDAVDYIIQCCEAMHVAHRAGIVHRDLKPANLFLTQRPDGSSIIKVLDFGISKVGGAEAAQLSLTRTQAMMGSPLYMSPEQMRSSKDVAGSTDIWALGVILHELISGEVPFNGASVTEVLVKVMTDAPPGLRSLRAEVPEALEAVVLRCLAKAPADRYSSVAALAVALSPFASGHTLGLQRRLHASLSERPAAQPAPGKLLGATRVEAGAHAVAPNPLPIATRIELGVPATAPLVPAVPAQTNTDWEDAARTQPRSTPVWRRRLSFIGGVVGLTVFCLILWARLRPSTAPHQEGPLGVSATAAPASAATPSPPEPIPTSAPSEVPRAAPTGAPVVRAVPAAAPAPTPGASAPAQPFRREGRDFYVRADGKLMSVNAGFDTSAHYPDWVPATAEQVAARDAEKLQAQRGNPSAFGTRNPMQGSPAPAARKPHPKARPPAPTASRPEPARAAPPPPARPKSLSIDFK